MDERPALLTAACAQAAVLVVLTVAVGLGAAGWAAGTAYLVAGAAVLAWAMRRAGLGALGPADLVTLARSVLIGAVAALVADGGHVWPVVVLAAVALALDLADGPVARWTRTESSFGARFDMEADAFLILVLSVHAVAALGPWVAVVGLMRYAFVLAGHAASWLRAPLPPSRARKVVAAVQGVALVAAVAPVLPHRGAVAVAAGALAVLVWSFGRDVLFLWRNRPPVGTAAPAAGTGSERGGA
ncbi:MULTISPECIES: CDP-alcohol phosphatidyltransferase family protein [unclassified Nocardiopsis]|uniref:CDP-alcohol phosphatidyltransferase family protein n=1 Tax=unclassified Nocardiopsis TaxID=2649073 RepID=UPI001F5B0B27|nr:CDP-alcohol phosphatidyltransferase family protein [Nocardiopsis sp. TSRI0078]